MNATSPSLVVETAPELVKLRQIASKAFIAGLWLMVLVVGGVASYTPAPQLTISLISAALAGVSTIMFLKDPIGPATRFAIGAALTTDWRCWCLAQADCRMDWFLMPTCCSLF